MSRIKAPGDLPDLVKKAFNAARANGDIHYFPTQVTILTAGSIPFQLRFSPALANKPKGPPPDPAAKSHKPFDPFENPPPALRVADVGPSHFVVLNKFAVVPEHFILATTAFKLQTHLLEPSDLEATLSCIRAYEGHEDGLFAFFNSGEHSGASQPHRHIQLLPIARMKDGLDKTSSWDVLTDRLSERQTPFAAFTEKIHLEMQGSDLHEAYIRLYRRAVNAWARFTGSRVQQVASEGEAVMSYNMAMTKTTLALVPRVAEGVKITSDDGHVLGNLALNGTLLAGTALVKSELEWEALRKDAAGLVNALRGIGLPHSDSIDAEEEQEKTKI
ncbi:HIT-like domain-containing protein [Emericellopsis atlantica]|uniref:HIT-like domain-containing protein n=1 Tax=Emericellopsis atlantica TaxID=2614577 RepID=A0A9P7ZT10_9HYPO|nr:HIT-like domain-containing protein [Emericellopsis atlantica]KAG9257135.1 HIT-like domain-containing protein [Emericellopsis atlantica]